MVLFRARRVSQASPVVLALGCLAGLGWLALRRGVSAEVEVHSFPAALLALALGLVGARLAFGALPGPHFVGNPLAAGAGCLRDECVYGILVAPGPLAPAGTDLFGVVAPRWPTAAAGMIATA